MDRSDKRFKRALEALKAKLDELNKLPQLKYPDLSTEMNDLLWVFDGMEECRDRLLTETNKKLIIEYSTEIEKRKWIIKTKYLHLLN